MPRSDLLAEQRRRLRIKLLALLALAALVLFIVSGLFAFHEFRYALHGRTATATVMHTEPAPAVGNNAMTITYSFNDPTDGLRTESHLFETNALEISIQQHFDVIYLPGVPNSSKPTFERHTWAIPVFVTMLLALIVAAIFIARLIKQGIKAMEAPPPKKRETFRIQRRTP